MMFFFKIEMFKEMFYQEPVDVNFVEIGDVAAR